MRWISLIIFLTWKQEVQQDYELTHSTTLWVHTLGYLTVDLLLFPLFCIEDNLQKGKTIIVSHHLDLVSQPHCCWLLRLDNSLLWSGGYPVHCRVFSNTPDLYPLDASSKPLTSHSTSSSLPHSFHFPNLLRPPPPLSWLWKRKMSPSNAKCPLGAKITWLGTTGLEIH